MTRIKVLKRAEMDAEQGRLFDELEAAGLPNSGPYWAYIRNPKVMRAVSELSNCLRTSGLTPRERQIAVLAVARHWSAKFPWAAQVRASLAAGVDQPLIDSINAGQAPKLAAPREQLAYQVATELLANRGLSETTYAAAEKAYKTEDLVTLVALVGQFSMTCCTANAFDITPPEGAPALR